MYRKERMAKSKDVRRRAARECRKNKLALWLRKDFSESDPSLSASSLFQSCSYLPTLLKMLIANS